MHLAYHTDMDPDPERLIPGRGSLLRTALEAPPHQGHTFPRPLSWLLYVLLSLFLRNNLLLHYDFRFLTQIQTPAHPAQRLTIVTVTKGNFYFPLD